MGQPKPAKESLIQQQIRSGKPISLTLLQFICKQCRKCSKCPKEQVQLLGQAVLLPHSNKVTLTCLPIKTLDQIISSKILLQMQLYSSPLLMREIKEVDLQRSQRQQKWNRKIEWLCNKRLSSNYSSKLISLWDLKGKA